MTRPTLASTLSILVLTTYLLLGLTASVALAQQVPPTPDPVAVILDASSTAVIVSDVNEASCRPNPSCIDGVVPGVISLLPRARAAGVLVVFSSPASNGVSPTLPEVGPEPGEPMVIGYAQDRFWNNDMDDTLRARGITTVIIVGFSANGSVLYTTYGAGLRSYTIVVPVDGTSAPTEAAVAIGRFQMLAHLGGNPTNEPLVPGRVTLSRDRPNQLRMNLPPDP